MGLQVRDDRMKEVCNQNTDFMSVEKKDIDILSALEQGGCDGTYIDNYTIH